MASRIILVSPLRLQLAMLSPVPHEMHLSNNQTANLLCSAIILEGLLRFLSLLGSTTVLPVLTRMCKNGCVSKEQQVCFFLRDGNKISLGQQQHLKQPGCWISLPHGYTVIHHKNTVEYSQQIDEHGYVTPKKTTEHKNPFVSWVDFSPPWLQHRRHFAPSP